MSTRSMSTGSASRCVGVLVFPGSNCDRDTQYALGNVCGANVRLVWHRERDLSGLDAIVVPGGFAHGDYLRTGAIARFSPVMTSVQEFAAQGGPVLGICNGFQILQEAGLLPGAMLRNAHVQFLSQPISIRVERDDTSASGGLRVGRELTMPIAHGDGNFYLPEAELDRLEANRQVVFRYAGDSEDANPNGSARRIAGVCNTQRNVVGLMPHPERATEAALGSADGKPILDSFLAWGPRDRR